MGDKNNIVEVTITDVVAKTGHGILKAVYVTEAGDNVWTLRDGVAAVAATGTATFTCAIVGDTVTINGLVYTGVCGAECACGDFTIACGDCAVALAFTVAVNCDCRVPTTIPSHDFTACDCANVVTIVSDVIGQEGNSIDFTTTAMCATIVLSPTTGSLLCGDGDSIFTVTTALTTNSAILMPYINHPVSNGILIDHSCGTTGRLAVVFE